MARRGTGPKRQRSGNCSGVAARSTVTAFIACASEVPASRGRIGLPLQQGGHIRADTPLVGSERRRHLLEETERRRRVPRRSGVRQNGLPAGRPFPTPVGEKCGQPCHRPGRWRRKRAGWPSSARPMCPPAPATQLCTSLAMRGRGQHARALVDVDRAPSTWTGRSAAGRNGRPTRRSMR